jgi:hypothetical protein
MTEKKITLIESFRTILRATYSQRPALADEIQSNQYFHYIPINRDTGKRDHPEAQAASDALDMLKNAIVGKQIRVCGCLDPNLPADIDPTEVTRTSDIHVFAGTIEVHRRGVTLRMYRNVHCYESEIATLIETPAESHAESSPNLRATEIRTRKHVRAETACGEYIRALPKMPRPRKAELEKLAREKFTGLSTNAFERQWGLHAHAEWRGPGAPRKTLQQ